MAAQASNGEARVHVLISGRVQGVMFRESTRRLAERLGLRGWIRNRSDGRVEAVFEGPPDALDQAVDWCRTGPPGAWVSGIERRDESPLGERGFEVRRTFHDWEGR